MKRAIRRIGSAEEPGSPKSFWGLQSPENYSEFAMDLERPVPCEQGAADPWATASSTDLLFLVCVFGVLDCGFVVLCFVSSGVCRFVPIAPDRSR